jgi:NADPH:quinone reductase
MQIAAITGGSLEVRDVPDPVPLTDQVLIQVTAAGVNHADLLQRRGHYPPPPGSPPWPGLEVSGTVVAVGDRATWRIGDRVTALLGGGGYADLALAASGHVLPLPEQTADDDAAALPEAACTIWPSLTAAGLLAGETLLVHGGSGGVGTIAIQIGRALGARVVATAGGAARASRCIQLGADVVVDYRSEDFVAVTREATEGRGADVVLDVVGGGYLERNLEVLALGGRIVVIGLQQGARAELDLRMLLDKRARVLGTTLRSRPPAEKAAIVATVREHVWPMVADGRVRPVIHDRLPLAAADRAHRLLESGEVFGKLLLLPGSA